MAVMPFEHREHMADVVLAAWGSSLAEAFESGAEGLFEIMVDTSDVAPTTSVEFTCEAEDIASLFVTYLNELLYIVDQQSLFFHSVKILRLVAEAEAHTVHAAVRGEPADFHKHHLRSEVKAATYGGLHYSLEDGVHRLECIIDI
jgi:protein archease